jgi:hypothetical protein
VAQVGNRPRPEYRRREDGERPSNLIVIRCESSSARSNRGAKRERRRKRRFDDGRRADEGSYKAELGEDAVVAVAAFLPAAAPIDVRNSTIDA